MAHEKATGYQITIQGRLDPDWSDWLNGFEIGSTVRPDGTWITTLTGLFVDQAALRGVLNRLWDLNLELLALESKPEPQGQEFPVRSSPIER